MKRLILLLLSCGAVYAQQNALMLPWTPQQFTNTNGTVLANGKVCTYQAGTSTGLATFTDSTASVSNNIPPNAILLDSTGRPTSGGIWLSPGKAYKIITLTAGSDSTCNTGVTVKTQDNVVISAGLASIINAAAQPGADIGAKINSACVLAAGQTVWVPASSAGSFTTTIAPATNIPCHILFDQGTWTYTSATNFLAYTGNNLVMEGGGSCNGQAAGATCVGGTQFVITNTAANGINCNGCPGAVFARFTLVGPNSGTGIGVIHSGILATYQDVQVRAFGGDGFQISGTRANSNEVRLLNVTSMSNKGWGFNFFGTNCNAEFIVTHAGTNTLGNYQSSCSSSNYLANSDGSVTGTGYTFLSGAIGNFGTLYSESGNETTCCVFNSGASSNHFTLTSQAVRTDNGTNNEFQIAGQHTFPPAAVATPGIVFESDAATGFIPNGTGVWDFVSSGAVQMQFEGARINQGSGKTYCWSSNANPTLAGCDTGLTREAPNTIDLGNSFGGSTNGILHYATHELLEGTAPAGLASNDVCYADSTLHAIKCSYNNGTFFQVPQVITATSSAFATATTAGTCVQNTTAVTNAATTMAVSISPVSTPGVGAVWSAFVSSAGNVTINECAVATSAGGTIAFNIRVTP